MTLRKVLEEESIDVRGMNGAQIAKELGITRQAVSATLKRAMGKMYEAFKKENKTSPFETAVSIAVGLEVDDQEFAKFFKMFPPKIRASIEADSENLVRK